MVKKVFPLKKVFLALLFVNCPFVFALDSFFVGIGNELNANSHLGMVASIDLMVGLDINKTFCVGIKASYHHDFNMVNTIEPRFLFRLYLMPLGVRPFIQAEAGAVMITAMDHRYYNFSGGITTGCRINLRNFFYIEPALRLGYPFLWGAGITAGFKFQRANRREL
jgi:hypothetical protein